MVTRGRRIVIRKKLKIAKDEELLDPNMDPMTLISHVRKEAEEELRRTSHSEQDIDLNHLVRTVRALLVTNKEIWERLEPYKYKGFCFATPSMKTFERVSYPIINVHTDTVNGTHNRLTFTTAAEKEKRGFRVLKEPAENLSRLVAIPANADIGLETYQHLFRGSLVLHEDVLIPFLLSLKDHLEATQVYLGKIEEWLMPSTDMIAFIEKHFDKKLELHAVSPSIEDAIAANLPKWGTDPNAPANGSRQEEHTETLKEFQVSGRHFQTFDIRKQEDQERLVKFLGCLSFL